MKAVAVVMQILLFVFVLAQTGCEQLQLDTEPPPKADIDSDASIHAAYIPARIDITPLTGLVGVADTKGTSKDSRRAGSQINVYVSLLDSFGCQIKSPGVFRFEMYENVQHSAEPKGRRIAIWPDTDLTDAAKNNKYWRDFLRTYQFNLPFEPAGNQSYILQVTFLCPTGKRLSDEFTFQRTK